MSRVGVALRTLDGRALDRSPLFVHAAVRRHEAVRCSSVFSLVPDSNFLLFR